MNQLLNPVAIGVGLLGLGVFLRALYVSKPGGGDGGNGLGFVKPPVIPIILLAAGLLFGACATIGKVVAPETPIHIATVTAVGAKVSTELVRDTIDMQVCGKPTALPKCISDADRRQVIAPVLLKAFDVELQAVNILQSLPADATVPDSVGALLGQLTALLEQAISKMPDTTARTALVTKLGGK